MKRIANAIARWYKGEDVPPDNDPGSPLIFMMGHQRYHWSARAARAVAKFYLKEWKWLWATVLTALGLLIATVSLLAALRKS